VITLTARRALPALLVIAMALALPAAGQEPAPTPRGERIIEAILIWRLVDELDLNEAQIARIFPRIKALKNLRLEMGRRVPVLMRDIRQLGAQVPRDDEQIRIKVTELNQLRAQVEVRRRRQLESIAAALTPGQLAKFALIQENFEAETIRLLEQMKRIAEEQSPSRR
jgi:Spy/CpxP family protein refolding chaperone